MEPTPAYLATGCLLALALVHCSSDPSNDAGAPPPMGSATPEGGVTPVDGSATDVGVDSAALDTDGGTDSGDASFFGASRCDAGAFIVCDGFEAPSLNETLWDDFGNQPGHATLDSTHAARGLQALHMRSPSEVTSRAPWNFLANGFYLRAFFYWAQPIADHHVNYLDVVQPNTGQFSLGSYDGQLAIIEFGPNNGDQGLGAKDNLPTGRWACIEWQVSPQTEEVHVLMDEAEIPVKDGYPFPGPTMHVTNWPPMAWSEFIIELNTAHPTDEMWIDELAIDTKPIGCRK